MRRLLLVGVLAGLVWAATAWFQQGYAGEPASEQVREVAKQQDEAGAKKRYEAKLEELHKQGEALTLVELAGAEIPKEENGAELYEDAIKDIRKDAAMRETHDKLLGYLKGDPGPEELKEARTLLDKIEPMLKELREAGKRKSCKFQVRNGYGEWSEGWEATYKLLSGMQAGARMLRVSSRVNLLEGKTGAALADYGSMASMGQAWDRDPRMISMLVGISLRGMAFRELGEVLEKSEPSSGDLQKALEVLGPEDDRSRLVLAMRGDRCRRIEVMKHLVEHPEEVTAAMEKMGKPNATITRTVLYEEGLRNLELMDRCVPLSLKPWCETKAEWEKLEKEEAQAEDHLFGGHTVPGLCKAIVSYDRGLAGDDLSRLAIGLRLYRMKHGEYPEELSALVPEVIKKLPTDPLSGEDYGYRREGKGFVVWSVGEDGLDNNGEETRPGTPDIAFKCSR